jgi:phage gpG-like protein
MIKLTTTIDELVSYNTEKINMFKDIKKLKEIKDKVVSIIREDADNRFRNFQYTDTGGFVIGNKEWKPVKDKYLLANPKRKQMPLLQDSGRLRDSIVENGTEGSYVEYTPVGVEIGSELEYARRQNEQRPFLFWSEELKQKVINYVAEQYQ